MRLAVQKIKASGSGILGMYYETLPEYADYIILKFDFWKSSASGSIYGQMRIIDTATNTAVWTSPNLTATTKTNYSYNIGVLNAGGYRLECRRLGSTSSHQIYLDNVKLAYLDTVTVINCDGGNKDYFASFQGQEHDDELFGEGNSVNFSYRMHNPRLGRFFAVDPLIKQYPHYSSYSFSGNKVIAFVEREGLEELIIHENLKNNFGFNLSLKLTHHIAITEEFYKKFESQVKYDIYFYKYTSLTYMKPTSEYASPGVKIDSDGYPYSNVPYSEFGETHKVNNKEQLDELLKRSSMAQALIDPKDFEESFKKGKSVILIGIAAETIDPFNGIEKLSNDVVPKLDAKKMANLIGCVAETLAHELDSHASTFLTKSKDSYYKQHENYHGQSGNESPSYEEIRDDADGKYTKTRAKSAVNQIEKLKIIIVNAIENEKAKK